MLEKNIAGKKFRLLEDTHFVEAGDYTIVRLFDDERVVVQLNPLYPLRSTVRQITILRLSEGTVL